MRSCRRRSLVPRNDPTLMFTNAGMVQFKNVFTGVEKRPYHRATTSQKCVRAGGKHNDLDNVGYTARHHTFFEMLGNFSFGDYFKARAIELAWNLITTEFGLRQGQADSSPSITTTTRPSTCGRRSPACRTSRIIRIATSDNFWAMGDTGPCGPCSEIFYDHGDHVAGRPARVGPDADGDRFIEIWNLVFMQYEQVPGGERVDLPRPSIDTGMGLERLAAVLQGKHDNYDIDLFRALIRASAEATGVDPDGPHKVSHRVIADHLRASSFLVADGVLPSNEGRGYVLRRIMRRAMRHAQIARRARSADVAAGAGAGARDGPGLSRTDARRGADHRDAEAGGDALPRDAGARPRACSTRRRATCAPAASSPARPPSSSTTPIGFPLDLTQDALRARGIGVDTRRLRRARWSASAPRRARPGPAPARRRPRRSGSRSRETRRRHRIPRLRHRERRGRRHGAGARRRRGRARSSAGETRLRRRSTRRRSTANPAARSATPAR